MGTVLLHVHMASTTVPHTVTAHELQLQSFSFHVIPPVLCHCCHPQLKFLKFKTRFILPL